MKRNRFLSALACIYAAVWVLAVVFHWLFCRESRAAMAYDFLMQIILLPLLTLVLSAFAGTMRPPLKYVWLIPLGFSLSYMLHFLVTQSLSQMLQAGVAAYPSISHFCFIFLISTVGLLIGTAIQHFAKRRG